MYLTCIHSRNSRSCNIKSISVKNYEAADDSNIILRLQEALLSFYDDNVNTMWTKFKRCCQYCIDTFIPNKMKRIGGDNPWITRGMIHLKPRLKHYRKQKYDNILITNLALDLKLKLRESTERCFSVKLRCFVKENPAKFWQYLSQKNSGQINQILLKGSILTDKKEIAESFNTFFQSVFSMLCSSMSNSFAEVLQDNENNSVIIPIEGVTKLILH